MPVMPRLPSVPLACYCSLEGLSYFVLLSLFAEELGAETEDVPSYVLVKNFDFELAELARGGT